MPTQRRHAMLTSFRQLFYYTTLNRRWHTVCPLHPADRPINSKPETVDGSAAIVSSEVKRVEMWSAGRLEWPDYVILAVFLAISLGIGVYQSLTGGRQQTTSEFILADRRLRVVPTTLSLLVSFQSAVMMLGLAAEMYQYGMQQLVWAPVGFLVTMVVSERLIVPWIYPLQLVSINDVSSLCGRVHVRTRMAWWRIGQGVGLVTVKGRSYRPSRCELNWMHGPRTAQQGRF